MHRVVPDILPALGELFHFSIPVHLEQVYPAAGVDAAPRVVLVVDSPDDLDIAALRLLPLVVLAMEIDRVTAWTPQGVPDAPGHLSEPPCLASTDGYQPQLLALGPLDG